MEPKILSHIDKVSDAYKEKVQIMDGLYFDHLDTIRTVEFYSNNQYLSGNKDGLGREKPFYNVCNYRVTTAKVATDLDVKDIKFEPDSLKFAVPTMLINRELFKYLKESNFSETLNDMGFTRPKYGGVLVKRYEDEDEELDIDVVEWKNVEVDPCDILGGLIIETHYMSASELAAKSEVWDNVSEVLKTHAKATKGKPAKVEVKEVTGEVPYSFDPELDESEENDMKFKTMCFYIAVISKKKYLLYSEELDEVEDKYRYLPWDKVPGRGLGRGVVEEGFESQVWVNDSMISMKNAMEISGKVLIGTDSSKISGNAITGVDNGHIFQMTKGDTIQSLNLAPASMPQFERTIELWNQQYDKVSSTYGANTGEAPTAGTPYSQTALLNQVANSPFEYQREVWGIWLNEILNDWILPHLKKRIKKGHTLVADYTNDELDIIDEAFANYVGNPIAIEEVLKGNELTNETYFGIKSKVKQDLNKQGSKRELIIPDKFLDIDGNITANITGELKNKAAMLASLDSVLKTIISTFNPNTGTYAALEDPTLSKIFGTIVEMSGIPISASMLKPNKAQTSPVQAQDLSAVTPVA